MEQAVSDVLLDRQEASFRKALGNIQTRHDVAELALVQVQQ